MKKIHFVGIGGIGMSGLAEIALAEGKTVTGSDLGENNLTRELKQKGAAIYKGHSAGNLADDVKLVVRSSCIRDDNPEIVKARDLGVPVIFRGEFLKMVMEEIPISIAVTGTHGKTTTSAIIAHIMELCGKDPIVIVGGEMEEFGSNAKYGRGGVICAEVDESDGSFRNIGSTYCLVTNIEREHMDYYVSLENLVDAYRDFVSRISPEGVLFFNGEDPVIRGLTGATKAKKKVFGIDGDFEVTCEKLRYDKSIEFDFISSSKNHGKVKSSLVGRHNAMNLLGAIAVCMETGLDFERVTEAVGSFRGIKRRFDLAGKIGTIEVIEDYAHHPTELSAVIRAAKDYGRGRVITVFQPHRYSRTNDLAREFLNCFYDTDILILTDVYSAFEEPVSGIGIRDIYKKMDKKRFERIDFVSKENIPEYVSGIVRQNDIVLVLGAGDIREILGPLVQSIEKRERPC